MPEPSEQQPGSEGKAKFWQMQLYLAEQDQRDFVSDGEKVVARYRSEKKSAVTRNQKRFNILYSNTEVLRAALYGRAAKPDVRRRFSDPDPVAREAADIMERALIYCQEVYDVDAIIDQAVQDYVLPGRGVVRVEYEPVITDQPAIDPMTGQPALGEDGQPVMQQVITEQKLYEKYVYWKDYLQSPARDDAGVWWRAYRHTFTREELEQNKFPSDVPLNWEPRMDNQNKKDVPDGLKKAEVWEIWDKSKRERVWIVKGYPKTLREDEDPYQLEGFFPSPGPLSSYATTDTALPEPEFHAYQDQADDLDEITGRISRLTKAMKRRGVYDKSIPELKRLANANDNEFVSVENYARLTEKGGLQAAFQVEDISTAAKVLLELYNQRNMLIQSIYEITGISDIVRGATDANETLGAQELKAQFGSQRMKRRQRAVQRFIKDLLNIKAEIIAEHFQPEMLSEMTGKQVTPEIMDLLRSDKMRGYKIDVETDSTVFEDAQAEKQSRIEAVTAIGVFLEKALPVVQTQPALLSFTFAMLSFLIRSFPKASELEDEIDQAKMQLQQAAQNPPPNPEAEKAKMEMELKQQDQMMKREEHQMDMQATQAKTQATVIKSQADIKKTEMDMMRAMMPQPEPQTVQ